MSSPIFSTLRTMIFIMLVLVLVFNTCDSQHQKLCGSKLNEAIKVVCRNKYNVVGKKSVTINDYYDDELYAFDGFEGIPFLNKLYGGAISPNVRRIKQGIVDECCKKPCTMNELSAYCGN